MQRVNERIEALISSLALEKHPEGGFFKECYMSADESSNLPVRFPADRGSMPFLSSIYYLLASPDYSTFHRIMGDELWYFHEGTGIVVHVIEPDGEYRAFALGPRTGYFCAVKAGSWFAAEAVASGAATPGLGRSEPRLGASDSVLPWALVSCAVSPGFDYRDFEIAKKEDLVAQFPRHRGIVERLTKA
jgi:hypothetical protein